MHNLPLVSIIISTHKGFDSVCKAVDSVLSQDYQNIEVIVVDDNGIGTEDQVKTRCALSQYIDNKKINYIPHEVNKNGSAARNTGWKVSSGKYIGFLDDDDVYLDGKVSKSVEFLESKPQYGAVFTNTIVVKKGQKLKLRTHIKGKILYEVLVHAFFMNPGTLLTRKSVVDEISGFDESFSRHQDIEFNTRLADNCIIGHINSYGSIYNRIVQRHVDRSLAYEYRNYYIKKMLPIIHKLPRYKQEVVLIKNAMDLFGRDKKMIIKTIREWDNVEYNVTSYYRALGWDLCQKLMYKIGAII